MSMGNLQDRYCYEKILGRDGPFVSQLVRLRTDGQAAHLLLRRLAPEVKCKQDALHAFIQTSERLSAVDAPNLLKLIDYGVDREGLYLVTEYPRHVTLMSLIGRITFPPCQAAMVVEQAARGMNAAGAGVIHGALTPQHLWITSTGIVKIKDFGLYLLFRDAGQWFEGDTPSYWFDPGVIAGRTPDESADCFSLGCILRELLRVDTIQKDAAGVYRDDLPQHIPDRLQSILATCLHADRTRRFGTSTDLMSALSTFLKEEGVTDAVNGLKSFLRQRANGSSSSDRPEQPAPVKQPDQNSALLDPSAFWRKEHEEYPVDEDDAASCELANTQAEGLHKLSRAGYARPRETEPPKPAAVGLNMSSEAVSEPRKKFSVSLIPDWLQVVGGIILAATIGGLLGWFLIGRWTLEEPTKRNNSISAPQDVTIVNKIGVKEDSTAIDSGTKPSSEPLVEKEVSKNNNAIPQKPTLDNDAKPRDKCIAGCGWIYITTVPSGATVKLDGNEVPGTTPILINEVSANDSHELRIMLSGKKSYKQNVNVNSGDVLNVSIDLN